MGLGRGTVEVGELMVVCREVCRFGSVFGAVVVSS